MVDVNELRGLIAKNNYTQSDIANLLGITPKTFYEKMKKRKFNSDEMLILYKVLHIEDPIPIFFAN